MKLKLLSLILIVAVCLSCLAGCGKEVEDLTVSANPTASPAPEATEAPDDGAESETATDSQSPAALVVTDYDAAYHKYDPDTIVMTVNGNNILWSDYFQWIYNAASQLEMGFEIHDWNDECESLIGYVDPATYSAYILQYAYDNSMQLSVISQAAKDNNIALTDAQKTQLDEALQSTYEQMGGKEAFAEYLSASFVTLDNYIFQNETIDLYYDMFAEFFGENGNDLPAEDAIQYLTDNGYMHAKHILFSTLDEDRQPLPEEAVAEKKALAEAVLAELKVCPAETLAEKFDELMQEHSEDPGSVSLPGGYYFTSGEMVAPFEEAVKALAENEISEIVESDYGYHIIFCPPMDADDTIGYDSSSQPYTPRALAAAALYDNMVNEWFDTATVVYAPEFENLDLNTLLNAE